MSAPVRVETVRSSRNDPQLCCSMSSSGPFVIFVSSVGQDAARPSFTNGVRRHRDAHFTHSSVACSGMVASDRCRGRVNRRRFREHRELAAAASEPPSAATRLDPTRLDSTPTAATCNPTLLLGRRDSVAFIAVSRRLRERSLGAICQGVPGYPAKET